jgi:hypothetical protein
MIPFLTTVSLAQQVTSVDRLHQDKDQFDSKQGYDSLPCSVEFTEPELNLGFRFQSNYTVRAPLDAYAGAGHQWHIVFRVTPVGGHPVYFVDFIDLPAPPQPSFTAVATGAFFTGQGHYDVKWSIRDDLGRVCQQDWTLDARLSGRGHRLKVIMPPGTVGDLSWHPASPNGATTTKSRHVTILMNAALPVFNVTKSSSGQWATLVTILSSILEGLPEANVRLVVFNLNQQRELYRKDQFTTTDLSAIAHFADSTSQWIVNSNSLQRPLGGWDLIRDIESNEINAVPSADAVVFLGLPAASAEKMPPGMPRPGFGQSPHFFYLLYRVETVPAKENPQRLTEGAPLPGERGGCDPGSPCGDPSQFPGLGGGGGRGRMGSPAIDPNFEGPDPIKESVRRMKGRPLAISSVDSLSNAISEISSGIAGTR